MTLQVIQHQELGASQAIIEFASIPQTYTDLRLNLSLRNTSTADQIRLEFNDSASGWSSRDLRGEGSGSATTRSRTDNIFPLLQVPSSYTSNTFSNVEIYITNYTWASAKTLSINGVLENNATTTGLQLYSGLWTGTAAITKLEIISNTNDFAQYSSATLYGILKGSDGVTTVS